MPINCSKCSVVKRFHRSVNFLFIVLKSRSIVTVLIGAHKNTLAANDNCGYISLVILFLTKLIHCCRCVKIVDFCCCFDTNKYLRNTFHSAITSDTSNIRKQLRNVNAFDSNRACIFDIILSINLTILSLNICSKLISFVLVVARIIRSRLRSNADGLSSHLSLTICSSVIINDSQQRITALIEREYDNHRVSPG
ncbi:unnamed protein product [Rotaria sp. Silwood2]|nr:unnamed protein product [Rotaria sp. Silwood2]CAF3955727.1 unnamed protein product [Rotaria sp. Silwood2]CAF4139911.1 unnamed protein product [Rotaria sp. Silwood2]